MLKPMRHDAICMRTRVATAGWAPTVIQPDLLVIRGCLERSPGADPYPRRCPDGFAAKAAFLEKMLCRAPQSSASALCHLQGGVGPPPPSGASLNRSPAPNAQPSLFNGAQRLLPLLPLGMRLGSDVDVGRSLRIEPLVLNGIKSDRSGNGPKNMPILRSRRKGGRSKSLNPGTSTGRRPEPQPRRRKNSLQRQDASMMRDTRPGGKCRANVRTETLAHTYRAPA